MSVRARDRARVRVGVLDHLGEAAWLGSGFGVGLGLGLG